MDRVTDTGYTITGGEADADRLRRQADVMSAASTAFLAGVGLASGWSCLDVGCGTGQMTIAMARITGPDGRVEGVDEDAEALAIARAMADGDGVPVRFVRSDAATLSVAPGSFDLAYSRLLLSHLVDPVAVLRQMRSAVRPGGVVAVEDLYTQTLHADPPVPALLDLQEIYCATVRFHGGDPTIGPRLGALLRACDLHDVRETTVANPMTTVAEKLFLAELVVNMRDAMLDAGVATAGQLEAVRAGIDAAARDPATTFYQTRIHQVWGRRPAGRP